MNTEKKQLAAYAAVLVAGLLSAAGCSSPDSSDSANNPFANKTTVWTDTSISSAQTEEITTTTETTKAAAAAATAVEEQPVHAIENLMSFQGRHIIKDDTLWLVQSGSSAMFTAKGTKASVTITSDYPEDADIDLMPRYAVYVDGELIADNIAEEHEKEIILFEGNAPRSAEVKIMLLSEAVYGAVGVKCPVVTGDEPNPLTPAPQKNLFIEFIGDSITCGFGVDGTEGSEPFKTSTENFSRSYAYIAAEELDADYSAVAYSGYGVISGYSSGEKNTDETVPLYYDSASRYEGFNEAWDFSQRKADAVVINLGTNDRCYVDSNNEYTCNEFTEGYKEFLKTVRRNNPEAVIICTVGLMGGEQTIYPLIQRAVSEVNDERITCFLSQRQDTKANGTGSCWHPSAITQRNYGHTVAEEIRKALEK
ncbi:MAG: GDSL-type esterase/lipase family protein [Ruminococcus sp.]